MSDYTIYAPATFLAKAGLAVIRVSGNDALLSLCALTSLKKESISSRKAYFVDIKNPKNNELIDQAIVIYFNNPHSFTGENVVEYHLHGSIAVIKIMMDILSGFKNYRIAEPGEFARRAFLNGKMDLTRAEGLADLIESETYYQHQQAIRQTSGGLEKLYNKWRQVVLEKLAFIEAYIDFPDEDIPVNILDDINQGIIDICGEITTYLDDSKRGEIIRNGIYISIIGRPNVGKSTLLNFLAKKDVAITSNIAGTTRDVIEVYLDIEGYPVTIADTAGIREGADAIEQEGIKRAYETARKSDFKIIMFANDDLDRSMLEIIDDHSIVVVNKVDLDHDIKIENAIYISLKSNIGVDDLLHKIKERIEKIASPGNNPLITRDRYRKHLQSCLDSLREFGVSKEIELKAEDLRSAAFDIGKITGVIDVEMVLDQIFSNFCIGK